MMRGRAIRTYALPLWVTVLLLAARLFAVPALSDPVSGPAPTPLRLHIPPLYLVLAPLFTLWDGASMLSISRLRGLLVGLGVLYLLWRIASRVLHRPESRSWLSELGILAVSMVLLGAFLVGGAVWHRPMLALEGASANEAIVDFHSHTNVSHDVRDTWMRRFDAEASRRWHARAGFDAFFITDHNTVAGLAVTSRREGPVSCPGTEVSAWHSHIVLLGDSLPVQTSRFNGSFEELLTLLRVSETEYGAATVASLPEYRRNFWGRLGELAAAGLDGFEIVNAAPKANELTQADRDSVIQLARDRNRFLVGVSDSHGWGATSMVWNLVRLSGRRDDMCSAILNRLRDGFSAVTIVERHRLRPDAWWPLWLTPFGVAWESWRSMGWALTWSWLAWIWAWVVARAILRRTAAA